MKPFEKMKNGFITGFLNGGTPFSAKLKNRHNPLREKADILMEKRDFKNEDLFDSICFISGGIFGCVVAPVDAVIVIYDNIKESFRIKND